MALRILDPVVPPTNRPTDVGSPVPPGPVTGSAAPIRSVDELLHEARRGWRRLPAHLAALAVVGGGLLVDIRPQAQRAAEGEVVGSVVIERNVLEWRLDPQSPHRLPIVTDHDQVVVVICSQGYASSFAAASLRQLGLARATDVIGGFEAWRRAGLPHHPPIDRSRPGRDTGSGR
jgi:rhodanese-related sulfurtransferase